MRPHPHQAVIANGNDFLAAAEGARARGRSLVLTSGVFDALDRRDLDQLRSAARYGDVLLVAVANDLQAPGCQFGAEHRAARVAALRWVDHVTVALTPPEWFVDALLPDVWVWSGPPERDPGLPIMRRHNLRVVHIAPPPVPDQGTLLAAAATPETLASTRLDAREFARPRLYDPSQ